MNSDTTKGIVRLDERAPTRCLANELTGSVMSKGECDDPTSYIGVQRRAVLYHAPRDAPQTAQTALDGYRAHAKRPLPGTAGAVGCE